jgi:hypothetical protein
MKTGFRIDGDQFCLFNLQTAFFPHFTMQSTQNRLVQFLTAGGHHPKPVVTAFDE